MDLQSYTSTSILFLRGCFPENCDTIEDLFDARCLNATLDEDTYNINKVLYDKIPNKFTTTSEWTVSTNLLCWSCDATFQNMPIFIPTVIDAPPAGISNDKKKTIIGSMDTLGNFCSWNCASQYICMNFKGPDQWEKHKFLKILYRHIMGEIITEIVPAPPKVVMEQYGGSKSRQEYMAGLEAANSRYETSLQHNAMEYIKK